MLDKLSDVQERDLKLDQLEQEKKQTPPELIETNQARDALERRLNEKKRQFDALRKQVKANELELASMETRRKSAASSAVTASSAKEASQYQNQELQFATRVQELEEDTLPLMEQMDGLEAVVNELETELNELLPQLQTLETSEQQRIAELQAQSQAIVQERDTLAADVDAGLLKQYEQVRRARRGLALVAVVGAQRCGGCNVKLPIHVLQKVKRGEGVTRCPSCGRILWNKED